MPGIGTSELLIIAGIVTLLFGSSQLPKLARSFGEAKRELLKSRETPESRDS